MSELELRANLEPTNDSAHQLITADGDLVVSIVSHGHGDMVRRLLEDLEKDLDGMPARVVLTLNIPENLTFDEATFRFPLRIIRNAARDGFGANHNKAFSVLNAEAVCEYFCILNPDIRFPTPVFRPLLETARSVPDLGVVAPAVKNPSGGLEDNARSLPTPVLIFLKAMAIRPPQRRIDWLAGMFLLVASKAFVAIGGFDERYFLYYEDVDLCCRLRISGFRIIFQPDVYVVHDAQRASHRNVFFFYRHVSSVTRFFFSKVYRQSRRLAAEEKACL